MENKNIYTYGCYILCVYIIFFISPIYVSPPLGIVGIVGMTGVNLAKEWVLRVGIEGKSGY